MNTLTSNYRNITMSRRSTLIRLCSITLSSCVYLKVIRSERADSDNEKINHCYKFIIVSIYSMRINLQDLEVNLHDFKLSKFGSEEI